MTNGKSGSESEPQMNVPISASYHAELKAIAFIDKKSMKAVVEGFIKTDGRGKKFLEEMEAKTKPAETTQILETPDAGHSPS